MPICQSSAISPCHHKSLNSNSAIQIAPPPGRILEDERGGQISLYSDAICRQIGPGHGLSRRRRVETVVKTTSEREDSTLFPQRGDEPSISLHRQMMGAINPRSSARLCFVAAWLLRATHYSAELGQFAHQHLARSYPGPARLLQPYSRSPLTRTDA
jgi:hypothetical protein